MTSSLRRILVIGAAFGAGLGSFGRRYNHLFYQVCTVPAIRAQGLTPLAERALAKARAKRERRQAKLRALEVRNQEKNTSGWPADNAERWAREYRNQRWLEQTILARVRGLVRPKVYRDILEFVGESGRYHSFAVTRTHGGERVDDYDYHFGPHYLLEYVSGGYSGDDYAGEIWIPLNAGYFFNFHYSS